MEMSLRALKIKAGTARLGSAMLAVAALAALSGCNAGSALSSSETLTQGYVIDPQAIDLVPPGSSREQVLLALGSPSTRATFDNEVFYYISQKRHRSMAWQNPHVVDQRVLAVYFGPDDRVVNIANYGMQDGKVFDFISRTTPTGGKDQNFLGQILSGFGGKKGQAPNLFGNPGG